MFSTLKLGHKIAAGFTSVTIIMLFLGGIAIYSMRNIESGAEMLAKDYVPEVKIASKLKSNLLFTMYNMRGYTYTEDKNFLKEALIFFAELTNGIKEGSNLSAKSKNLAKIKDQIMEMNGNVIAYEKLIRETEKIDQTLDEQREKMEQYGKDYTDNINSFLNSQNSKMNILIANKETEKMREVVFKITRINDAVNYANTAIIATFKSQALRSTDILKEGLKEFEKIAQVYEDLIPITTESADIKALEELSNAGAVYENAMKIFLDAWLNMEAVNKERNIVGENFIKDAQALEAAGMLATEKIAEKTDLMASASNITLVIGLIIAVILGFIFSAVITKSIVGPITRAVDTIKESSAQIFSASEQVSEASQQLSQASSEQASSIEETSASLEEMSGMVKNNVKHAEKSSAISENVKEVSLKGNNAMLELINSMNEIMASNEKIQELVKVIGEIAEKTAIIDEIVFQTKLLSFNASVEAERAGEHGRGFAVVAQEVGNLAQMSGKAALDISLILKESISSAEKITTENRQKVETGNIFVRESTNRLKEISENAIVVSENARHILTASKDQATGIEQINRAMSQLDNVTQDNASVAEEAATAAEELTAQAESLTGLVEDLTIIIFGKYKNGYEKTILNRDTKKAHSIEEYVKNGLKNMMKKKRIKSDKLDENHENGNGHKNATWTNKNKREEIRVGFNDDWEEI